MTKSDIDKLAYRFNIDFLTIENNYINSFRIVAPYMSKKFINSIETIKPIGLSIHYTNYNGPIQWLAWKLRCLWR